MDEIICIIIIILLLYICIDGSFFERLETKEDGDKMNVEEILRMLPDEERVKIQDQLKNASEEEKNRILMNVRGNMVEQKATDYVQTNFGDLPKSTQQGIIQQEIKLSEETGGTRHDAAPTMIRSGGAEVPSLTPPTIIGKSSATRVNLPIGLDEPGMIPIGTKASELPPEYQLDSVRPEIAAKLEYANEKEIPGLRIPSTTGLPDDIDDPAPQLPPGALPDEHHEKKFMKTVADFGDSQGKTDDELASQTPVARRADTGEIYRPEEEDDSPRIGGARSYRGRDTKKIGVYGKGATAKHAKLAKVDSKNLAKFGIGDSSTGGKPKAKKPAAPGGAAKPVVKQAALSKGPAAAITKRMARREPSMTLKDVKQAAVTKRKSTEMPSALDMYDAKNIDAKKGIINLGSIPSKTIPKNVQVSERGIPILKSRTDATFNYEFDYNNPGSDPAPENQLSYVSPYRMRDSENFAPYASVKF